MYYFNYTAPSTWCVIYLDHGGLYNRHPENVKEREALVISQHINIIDSLFFKHCLFPYFKDEPIEPAFFQLRMMRW